MNVEQLRAECLANGIATEGTKTQLKKRLKKHAKHSSSSSSSSSSSISSSTAATTTSSSAAAATLSLPVPICAVFLKAKKNPRRCMNPVCLTKSKLYCRFHLGNPFATHPPFLYFLTFSTHWINYNIPCIFLESTLYGMGGVPNLSVT